MITDSMARVELSADEEIELIRAAREKVTFNGVTVPTALAQAAKERLIAAYAPIISRASHVDGMEWEDVESALLEAFLRAIEEYDFASGNRLNYEIRFRFANAVSRLEHEAFRIPTRTKALFYQIYYKEADASWNKALQIVEHHPLMSHGTFVAIGQALNSTHLVGDGQSLWGQEPPRNSLELTDFVQWLLGSLNERERTVIELHYGFDREPTNELRLAAGHGYNDDLGIPQIASLLNIHRQTAWRAHNGAIDKMRSMINADTS